MDTSLVMDIAIESLIVTTKVAFPILAAALLAGLLVGVLQAATSIQEMTLTFVPKILVIFVAIILFLPFMMTTVVEFSQQLFVGCICVR